MDEHTIVVCYNGKNMLTSILLVQTLNAWREYAIFGTIKIVYDENTLITRLSIPTKCDCETLQKIMEHMRVINDVIEVDTLPEQRSQEGPVTIIKL